MWCGRTPEGRKCRLGEGGFGVVYKAVMNGVDEVAVKLVKVRVRAELGRRCCSCSGLSGGGARVSPPTLSGRSCHGCCLHGERVGPGSH